MIILTYLVLGALAGVLAGLFGIGGGLVIVPVLVWSLGAQGVTPDVIMHLAVGTSLASILFTSINSVRTHHLKGSVVWPVVMRMGAGILVGSSLGAITAAAIPGEHLQTIIGVFAVLMAAQMATGWQPGGLPAEAPQVVSNPRRETLVLGTGGAVIGWASAIFGIGGGSLVVPWLSWRGMPVRQAVGIAAACGLPIAVSGTLTFMWAGQQVEGLPEYSLGYVYLPALLGIVLTSVWFARLGALLAHRLPAAVLKRSFALLLAAVGLHFLLA